LKILNGQIDLKTTHGIPYKAVNSLERILTTINQPFVNQQVHKYISKFLKKIRALKTIKNFKKFYAELLLEKTRLEIENNKNFPSLVKDHLINIMVAVYREEILGLSITSSARKYHERKQNAK
jgi:hypothetical protein